MSGLLGKMVRQTADLMRLTRFFQEGSDPWERIEMPVAARCFGLASDREFGVYLDGPSRVNVSTVEEVCEWLRGCEAVDDLTLFFQPDFWQHPVTFEHLRKGDCEDHSLWAWRHLHRLGKRPLFMAGLWKGVPHTWVLFRNGDSECLLETTCKAGSMLHSVEKARAHYCPALAVDARCRTFVYHGYRHFHSLCGPAR